MNRIGSFDFKNAWRAFLEEYDNPLAFMHEVIDKLLDLQPIKTKRELSEFRKKIKGIISSIKSAGRTLDGFANEIIRFIYRKLDPYT